MRLSTDIRADLLIAGDWRPASDGERFDVIDPADGSLITTVASASTEDGIAAVEAAHRAFEIWSGTPPRVRGEVLRRAYELMTERREEIAELIVRENGKAVADARAETAYAAEFFRWYGEESVRVLGSVMTAPAGGKRIIVQQHEFLPWPDQQQCVAKVQFLLLQVGPKGLARTQDGREFEPVLVPEIRIGDPHAGQRRLGRQGGFHGC